MKQILILLLLAVQIPAYAGRQDTTQVTPNRQNYIGLEIGGSSLYYDLAYERTFLRMGKFNFYGRIAGSYLPFSDMAFLTINKKQLAYSIEGGLTAGNKRHKFVLGFSYNYSYYYQSDFNMEMPVATGDFKYMDVKMLGIRAGYRHNFLKDKFRFDVGVSPLWIFQKRKDFEDGCGPRTFPDIGTLMPWIYIGFGVNF